MTNKEEKTKTSEMNPLKAMVEKLDNRLPGASGYVAQLPELQAILNQLSPLVSVSILETHSPMDVDGEISVEVNFSFTLERDLL